MRGSGERRGGKLGGHQYDLRSAWYDLGTDNNKVLLDLSD